MLTFENVYQIVIHGSADALMQDTTVDFTVVELNMSNDYGADV